MTEAKPLKVWACVKSCEDFPYGEHAPHCPNAAPKASEDGMTETKPCLPECRVTRFEPADPFGEYVEHHAPGCPNAASKASEAPVEEKCATCGREEAWHHGSMHGFRKPAPAPEPKQGSEEPIEPVTELEAEKSTSKILRALLAKAEAERDEARATKDMHKERQEEAWAEVTALRADLAAAREEIAKLRKFVSEAMHEADAEKARADRAEERVKELEDQDLQVLETDDTSIDLIGFWRNARARARAILAARARKEGGSR